MPSWAHGGASRRDSVAAAAREVETGYFSSRIYSETTSHPIYFLAWKSELTAEHRGGSVSAYSMDWNVLYEGEEDDFLLKASSALLLLPTGRLLASSAETTFRLLLVVVHFVNAEIGWTFMDLCLHWASFLSFPLPIPNSKARKGRADWHPIQGFTFTKETIGLIVTEKNSSATKMHAHVTFLISSISKGTILIH
jgi:hypothetical protein